MHPSGQTPPPALVANGISKAYPGVQALLDVSIAVAHGEIHALIGENGAGKSTLMKILFGIVQPDTGTIEIDGKPVHLESPLVAQANGISMVHQELNLIPALDVARNIYLGREPMRPGGLIDWPRLYGEAQQLLDRLRLPLRPKDTVRKLSTA
ncbi:MAG: ATP-binding cassette domain-containing protein, partial [Thermomicrobiales bacterium]